jgi:hypothetical protein
MWVTLNPKRECAASIPQDAVEMALKEYAIIAVKSTK